MANKPGINNLFNIFEGMNAFGAGPGARTRSLLDTIDPVTGKPLITQDAIDKANRQSIGTGIVTGLASYLAQPKNKGYGSAVPYLAQSYLQANKSAQAPFQGVADQYLMDTQLKEQQRVLGERTKTQGVIDQMIASDPNLEYLRNAPLAQQITAINENTKLKMTPAKTSTPYAKVKAGDVTKESWIKFTTPGTSDYQNYSILDGVTEESRLNIEKIKAEIKYNFPNDGITTPLNNNTTQTEVTNKEPVTTSTNPNVKSDPLVLSKIEKNQGYMIMPYSGEKLIPRFIDRRESGKTREDLRKNQTKAKGTLRARSNSLREERKKIANVINNGSLSKITGVMGTFPNLAGGDAENTAAMLKTIKEKEFLNNYLSIKASGGGFGSLSEKEGERLEQMRVNLDKAQSAEQIEALLIELDDILAKEELSIYETYTNDYGAYDYKPIKLTALVPKYQGSSKSTVPGFESFTKEEQSIADKYNLTGN